MSGRIQGVQRQSDGKGCILLLPQEQGERWACLATFFLALGVVDFTLGNAWNLLPWATGVGVRAGQSSEGIGALAGPFLTFAASVRAPVQPRACSSIVRTTTATTATTTTTTTTTTTKTTTTLRIHCGSSSIADLEMFLLRLQLWRALVVMAH